jgi:hypothetical protein
LQGQATGWWQTMLGSCSGEAARARSGPVWA